MAALYDNSVEAFSASASTTLESAAFTIGGANRVLYVFVATGAGTPVIPSAVKWGGSGGTSLTQISSTLDHHANGKFSLWRLIAPAAQSGTVHVTWPAAQDERYFIAYSAQDADQTTPNGTVAAATGNSTTPSAAADSASGDLVICGTTFLDTGGAADTLSTADTSRQEIEGADLSFEGMGVAEKTATGASTTMSWTISNAMPWGIYVLAINGVSGGGGGGAAPVPLLKVGDTGASPGVGGAHGVGGTGSAGSGATVANAASATTASAVAGTQAHAGSVAAAASAATASAPAGTQTHAGAVANAASATAASTVSGTIAVQGVVANASSATAAGTAAGTQAHAGVVAAASSATAASTPAGSQSGAGLEILGHAAPAASRTAVSAVRLVRRPSPAVSRTLASHVHALP